MGLHPASRPCLPNCWCVRKNEFLWRKDINPTPDPQPRVPEYPCSRPCSKPDPTDPTSTYVAVSIVSENWNIMGTSLQENNAALLLHNKARQHSWVLSSHQPSAFTVVQKVKGIAAYMKKLRDHPRRTEVASGPVQEAKKVWVGNSTNLRVYLCKLLYHAPSAIQQSIPIACF
jgi:hypothetical protein